MTAGQVWNTLTPAEQEAVDQAVRIILGRRRGEDLVRAIQRDANLHTALSESWAAFSNGTGDDLHAYRQALAACNLQLPEGR